MKEHSNLHIASLSERQDSPRPRLALNFTDEEVNISKLGDAYLPVFADNLKSLALETDTDTSQFSFRHSVKRHDDGSVELFLLLDQSGGAPKAISARESYARPLSDPALRDWERQRALREYRAIVSLEQQLETAREGDTFIEASNAPFDRQADELEGTFYGQFSFLRTHTLSRDEKGNEVLEGQALRHYLTWDAQTQLYKALTQDEDVTPESLLGTMRRLQPQQSLAGVESLADIEAYIQNMPEAHKIAHATTETKTTSEDLHAFIDSTRGIIIAVFGLLKEKGIQYQQKVMGIVTEWRKIVRKYYAGEDVKVQLTTLEDHAQRHLDALYDDDEDFEEDDFDFGTDTFVEGDNSCGFGMGFAGGVAGIGPQGLFGRGLPSYMRSAAFAQMLERETAQEMHTHVDSIDRRQTTCPSCNSKVVFSRAEVVRKEHIACECGASARGCDAVSIAEAAKPAEVGPSMLDYDRPIAA